MRRDKPNDVLFLMPVKYSREKLPRNKVRMLYCDGAGKVYASLIDRSVYELAVDGAGRMESGRKFFATLGLELGPGRFVPAAVEIGPEEVWALEHIAEHAMKNGKLPDILKGYLKPIIKLGEANREEIISQYRKQRRRVSPVSTPQVLNRLSYYSERDVEISIPIYKAEHSYPLVVLQVLPADEHTPQSARRLLILDSGGDMAVIRVSLEFIREVEKGLKKHRAGNGKNVCAVISQHPDGSSVDYMTISQQQRKALNTITRYYTETGYGKRPISIAAKTVLTRARDRLSSASL